MTSKWSLKIEIKLKKENEDILEKLDNLSN